MWVKEILKIAKVYRIFLTSCHPQTLDDICVCVLNEFPYPSSATVTNQVRGAFQVRGSREMAQYSNTSIRLHLLMPGLPIRARSTLRTVGRLAGSSIWIMQGRAATPCRDTRHSKRTRDTAPALARLACTQLYLGDRM